ncbi:hypothetical protein NUW54_g12663 [Trametes sanguinea]|uniref:Uncharacterized protein n=1 Tax=Trametes sanguinea TaxID=158606 RepID=A0ACC1MUR4_9APHY|nr:hypothetical protein NUW54_g12663 [Trametes sanguinea]
MHLDTDRPTQDVEFNEIDSEICTLCETALHDPHRLPALLRYMCVCRPVTRPAAAHAAVIDADLHDLHDLRSRSLVFVHNLVETLRASGVAASYRLQPASCPMCLVCALPSGLDATKVKAAAFAAVQNAKLDSKEKALLADLEDGYALIIT